MVYLYYTSENVNPGDFFDDLVLGKRLSDDASQYCDGLLTVDEYYAALNGMSLNKSPGSDGLSVNFYKHFWFQLASWL